MKPALVGGKERASSTGRGHRLGAQDGCRLEVSCLQKELHGEEPTAICRGQMTAHDWKAATLGLWPDWLHATTCRGGKQCGRCSH